MNDNKLQGNYIVFCEGLSDAEILAVIDRASALGCRGNYGSSSTTYANMVAADARKHGKPYALRFDFYNGDRNHGSQEYYTREKALGDYVDYTILSAKELMEKVATTMENTAEGEERKEPKRVECYTCQYSRERRTEFHCPWNAGGACLGTEPGKFQYKFWEPANPGSKVTKDTQGIEYWKDRGTPAEKLKQPPNRTPSLDGDMLLLL